MIVFHMSLNEFDEFDAINGGVHCGSLLSAYLAVEYKLNNMATCGTLEPHTPVYVYAVRLTSKSTKTCDDMVNAHGWEQLDDGGLYAYTNAFEYSKDYSYFSSDPSHFEILEMIQISYLQYKSLSPLDNTDMFDDDYNGDLIETENCWEDDFLYNTEHLWSVL